MGLFKDPTNCKRHPNTLKDMAQIPVTWNGSDSLGKPLLWSSGITWNGVVPPPKSTRMSHLRVLLGFTTASDASVLERAQAVHDHLYTSPLWAVPPNPVIPVTAVVLDTAMSAFSTAMAAADLGGPADTADKNGKRDVLVTLLRQLASYVQANHDNDLAKLLASGFEAVSTNHASTPLVQPTIKDIINGMSGQLILRVSRVVNAKAYEVRYALIGADGAPGPWLPGGLHTSSRALPIGGLTPGSNYQFQVRAVGGSTGYSDWSNPVSHRSL
jgi:hypothetical protein